MKNAHKDRMTLRYGMLLRNLISALLLPTFFLLTGCDASLEVDEGEEGGVIGTGVMLRGTASETRAFAINQVDIRSVSGEVSSGVINEQGRYSATVTTGSGPWLLRTDLGDSQYRYGIAFGEQVANIHSYSDVILRNWFARNINEHIDEAFNSNVALPTLPTELEFQQIATALFTIVNPVLTSYNLTGDQLLFDPFDTDDTGIDQYLDNNPFIVENNIIFYVLTDPSDPSNLTQSTSRSRPALDADFLMPDTEPPAKPAGVRVSGASSEIVVLWEPVEDNVGIASYQVYRDNELIKTTPFPVYTDSNLLSGTIYRYEIVAVDAAGNSSDRSATVMGTTLGEPDTQPPPAPTTLTLLQSTGNRIDLIWGQSSIGDVVRFNIYRGRGAETPQKLLEVTSSFMTDAAVTGADIYCYQVSSEDASGNESLRSDVLCVDTTGESSGQALPETVPPLAGLNVPDTLTIPCATTLSVSRITENTTLSEPCYLVQQSVEVDQFANLTLLAGTVLKFAQGTRLQINEGASLTINGSPEAPVVLTGQQPLPGHWEGVLIDRSNHPANLIRNTVIEYAGGGDIEGGLRITSSQGAKTRIRIENSLFRFSERYGLSLPGQGTVLDAFTGNLVTQNNRPALVNLETLHALAGFNDFSGNDEQIIAVPRLPTTEDIVVPDLGVPVLSGGMVANSSLKIEAGVEMRFLGNSVIEINGEFLSAGSAEKPVTLTANVASPGEWIGLSLHQRSTAELRHTVVEFAGGTSDSNISGENGGAIQLTCSVGIPAQLSISDSDIVSSGGWGIFLDEPGCDVNVGQEVRFIDNASGDINIQ